MSHPEVEGISDRRIEETYLSFRTPYSGTTAALWTVWAVAAGSILYWRHSGDVSVWEAIPQRVFENHEYWRLFTALLAHANAEHLLANILPLALFSYLLYGYFGFWIHPVFTVILGALTNYLALLSYHPTTKLVGASGMIYGMMGFWLAVFVLVDRKHSIFQRFLRSSGFLLLSMFSTVFDPTVSYRAHGIGLFLGIAGGIVYFLYRKEFFRSAEVLEYD